MSFFSQAIQDVLNQREWAQKDACAAFGLTTATMSQYIGGSRNPAPKQLAQILSALTEPERAALQIAIMRDTIPAPEFRNLVLLTDATESTRLRDEAEESWRRIALPEDVSRAVEILVQAAKTDPDVAALLISCAGVIEQPPK